MLVAVLAFAAFICVPVRPVKQLRARLSSFSRPVELAIALAIVWTVVRNVPTLYWLAPDR